MRVHFVFEGDGDRRIWMPESCDCLFATYGDAVIHSIDLSGVDTSCVMTMVSMFENNKNIRELDLRSFDMRRMEEESADVGGVTNIFRGCSALEVLNISSFTAWQKSFVTHMFGGVDGDRVEQGLCKLITTDIVANPRSSGNQNSGSKSTFSQPKFIEKAQLQREHFQLSIPAVLEQEVTLLHQIHEGSNEDSNKEKAHEKADKNEENNLNIKLDGSISSEIVTDNKISDAAQHTVPQGKKEKTANAGTATVDVKQAKQESHWYTPVIKFCSWAKRKVLSWFK